MVIDAPDPFVPVYIAHGVVNHQVEGLRISDRSRDVPSLSLTRQTDDVTAFPKGSAHATYTGMKVVEREPVQSGPVWLMRLLYEGILGSESYIELNKVTQSPEEGWDVVDLTIFTATPNIARWQKGSQLQLDPLTGVTGEADDDLLTKAAHGLTTGQAFIPTFASGFAGLTSGTGYFACVISSSTLKAAVNAALAAAGAVSNNGTPFAITGTQSTNKINATAHGLANGTCGIFPSLTGGAGLTAATVPYYVVNAGTNDFEVSLTPGGTAVNFTTDISAGTFRTGTTIDITTDGTGMEIAPVVSGMEACWITDRRVRAHRAQGYFEIDLQLKGLLQTEGESKPVKRSTATSAQSMSLDRMTKSYSRPTYTGWPPVEGAAATKSLAKDAAQVDQPQTTETHTMITTERPPTDKLGAHWTPDDPPTINLYSFDTGATKVVPVYHLPWGWKLSNLQAERILDKQLWLLSLTWTYQHATTVQDAPLPELEWDGSKWMQSAP